MKIEPLPLRGAFLLRDVPAEDDRGSFRRVLDLQSLREVGAEAGIAQVSIASNHLRGTIRGLHYQAPPREEAKSVWCLAGGVFDVLVDLRPDEPTYGQYWYVTLRADEPLALHVPRGVAHGYQTLADQSSLAYAISTPFDARSARSLHCLDRTLSIPWPLPVSRISDRDREAPPWPPAL